MDVHESKRSARKGNEGRKHEEETLLGRTGSRVLDDRREEVLESEAGFGGDVEGLSTDGNRGGIAGNQ